MSEIWKQIDGHPNHFVSSIGRVRSIDHIVMDKGRPSHRKGKIFHLTSGKNGYVRVYIEKKCYAVHRIVASTFIPRAEGLNVVNHINGIKTDNRVENLEWTTQSENLRHGYKIGLSVMTDERRQKIAKSHKGMKLSEETKKKIGSHHAVGYKHSEETKKRISESITKWHKENVKNKSNI